VSADGLGAEWEFFNLAAVHNGLLRRPLANGRNGTSLLGFHPMLANVSALNSPQPRPEQTTSYTSLAAIGDNIVVVVYDRLANGPAGPMAWGGAWGVEDMVFSMRIRVELGSQLKTEDSSAMAMPAFERAQDAAHLYTSPRACHGWGQLNYSSYYVFEQAFVAVPVNTGCYAGLGSRGSWSGKPGEAVSFQVVLNGGPEGPGGPGPSLRDVMVLAPPPFGDAGEADEFDLKVSHGR
jgi:hypothetical protein